jgi:antitoxin (DNA-binding transcriptional repressor) of toxin-antitoxin stability system
MIEIDLDDLPPRVAQRLGRLEAGEELVLVQGGGLVARLIALAAPAPADPLADLPPEERLAEVMDHFKSMIEEEF